MQMAHEGDASLTGIGERDPDEVAVVLRFPFRFSTPDVTGCPLWIMAFPLSAMNCMTRARAVEKFPMTRARKGRR